jgi:hypothetical protein
MPNRDAILEQVRTLVADLPPEDRLSIIRTIATIEPVPEDLDVEETEEMKAMLAEQEAWFAQPKANRKKYQGEYVAVQNRQVLDHDADKRALYLRTRQYSKQAPILLVHADWDSIPEYTSR